MLETCIFLLFKSVTVFHVALNRNFPFDFITAAYTAVKPSLLANTAQFIANPGHCISQMLLMCKVLEQKSPPSPNLDIKWVTDIKMLCWSPLLACWLTINPNSPRAGSEPGEVQIEPLHSHSPSISLRGPTHSWGPSSQLPRELSLTQPWVQKYTNCHFFPVSYLHSDMLATSRCTHITMTKEKAL